MATSTNLISGLSSGFDWRSMIDQLISIEHRPVDLVEKRKSEYETKLAEWQSFNTMLLALDTSAKTLADSDNFYVYISSMTTDSDTVEGEDLLSISTTTTASTGSYTIEVSELALAQKLSSNPFSSRSEELGSSYAGEIVINGNVLSIEATDNLADVAYNINGLNTGTDPSGVTATVIRYGTNDYRLILTSDETGADGMSLLNGSSTNLVQKFGWKDGQATVVKNAITNGAQSDLFTNPDTKIQSLLGLATGEISTVDLTIGGTRVIIDLGNMSLNGIKTAINDAAIPGVEASVISEVVDGATYYRLQIEGTQTFVDENNILNTLGILDHTSLDVTGKISGNGMTSDGNTITAETLLTEIDSYGAYTAGDKITLSGNQTDGTVLASFDFLITTSTTVQDLLDAIGTQYSTPAKEAVAYVTSDGKIRVDDVAAGGGLSVILTDNLLGGGQLEFVTGDLAFGVADTRTRQIVAGEDAEVVIDGVTVTSSSNTINDVITGVTLNLLKEDKDTTVTLNIENDLDTIKSTIEDFVTSYNEVMTYINSQFSYDEDAEETGGVLFGDGTLSSVKSDLVSLLTQNIWGVNSSFTILGLVGITMDNDLLLSIDDSKLSGFLETNLQDILSLFAGRGVTFNSSLSYIGHTNDSEAGRYGVHINRAATQATETGNVDLTTGGAGETLTITQGNSTATVSITADMTLGDIENAINTELDAEYSKILVGDQEILEGGSAATSQTKWVDIDGTTWGEDKVISFSGTSRSGSSVSGTYTIDDVSTDTIQGLLSAIETAYSNQVTATVDTSGRIVVTDMTSGYSQISVSSIDGPEGSGLDFGTVDVTAGAGDGSQAGRYVMALTADHDASNQLVIRSDDYGSTSFTISQDTTDNNYHYLIYSDTANTTDATDGTVYITSSTTWGDIHDAAITNGEIIQIRGTARDGNAISLDHVLNTGNTVEGLLADIETAFAAQTTTVNAFVRDGKIYVEDTTGTTEGLNPITLTLNYTGSGSLDLGTVNQNIKRDLDLGLIDGTVTGQDVAGTIGGEAATGSGRVLTGNSGNANTAGLAARYSGMSNDVDAGDIQLTLGVAELFKRTLYSITDASDGYATFKQESIQDLIKDLADQVEEMEARLDRKMESMINRFVAMELAMSKIQSMSSWLSGQINAASNGWV